MGYFRWPSLNLLNGESKNMVVIFPRMITSGKELRKVSRTPRNYYSTGIEIKVFRTAGHNLTPAKPVVGKYSAKRKHRWFSPRSR